MDDWLDILIDNMDNMSYPDYLIAERVARLFMS